MRFLSLILLLFPGLNQLAEPDNYHCPTQVRVASAVGWPDDTLQQIDNIMWAESRCDSTIISSTGDYGLFQLNWSANGHWIERAGYNKEDLLNSAINSEVALMLSHYAHIQYGCRFQPWYMSGDWC